MDSPIVDELEVVHSFSHEYAGDGLLLPMSLGHISKRNHEGPFSQIFFILIWHISDKLMRTKPKNTYTYNDTYVLESGVRWSHSMTFKI